MVGVVVIPGLGGVLLASLVLGVGSGFLEVGPNVAVGLMFTGSFASAALAGLHAMYGAGSSLGPGAVGALGWQSASWVGALACITVAGVVVMVRMPRQEVAARDRGRVVWRRLFPLGVFVLIYNGLEFAVGDWLYVQLNVGMRVDAAAAVGATTLFWLMLTAGRLVAVPGLRRFGRQRVMAGALVLSLIGLIGLSVTTLPVPLVFVALSMVAFGFAPIHPISVSLASDSQPGAEGRAIGVLGALAAIGSMVVPVLHGWVGAGHDGGMVVSLVGVVLLIAIGLGWLQLWGGKKLWIR
jgi:fucose permease